MSTYRDMLKFIAALPSEELDKEIMVTAINGKGKYVEVTIEDLDSNPDCPYIVASVRNPK